MNYNNKIEINNLDLSFNPIMSKNKVTIEKIILSMIDVFYFE